MRVTHLCLHPKHGSWLNLVETLFGKMAKTFLKRTCVNSKQELKEINDSHVVHEWKKFDVTPVF